MEEVIGSIPIRSTNLAPLLGAHWCQFLGDARAALLSCPSLSSDDAYLRRCSAWLSAIHRESHRRVPLFPPEGVSRREIRAPQPPLLDPAKHEHFPRFGQAPGKSVP